MSQSFMRKHPWAAIIGLAVLLSPASLFAVNTKSQTDETEADFQKGELKSTSLSTEGVITIAPALKKLFGTGEAMVWDVAVSPKGDVYIATGHEGKVFKYSAEETTGTLYCDLKEAEATALALSPKGDLYVGASPGGRIYRVRHADRPTTFCATRETYIWDLEFDRDSGDLYAATGTKGRILAIGPDGKSRVYYQSKANNVLSLCKQPKQPLLAATHKPALVLEIPKESEAKVLIDGSPYEEARSVVRGKGGAVYAALNTERSPLEMLRQLAAAAMAAAASGASKPIAGGGGVDRETPSASRPPTMAPPKLPTPKESACQIVKINANGFVQTVWMSPEAPIHCIRYEAEADRLLAGVGGKGAVYEIRENGQATRLSQVEQRNVIAMAAAKKLVYIGTAESGVVYTMSGAEGLQGVYISRPLDGDDPVQWGSLRIRANAPEGTSITLAVRQGNTEDPSDKTWTAWSAEQAPVDQQVKVGGRPTRFLQYRVTLGRAAIDSPLPTLDTVEAFYLTPNLAPVIKEVKVSTRPGRGGPSSLGAPKPPSSSSGGAPTPPTSRPPSLPMPSPGGEAGGGGAGGREGASVAVSPNSNEQSVQVSWNVDEPNDDQTQVDVLFKGEKETVWRKLNTEPIRGTSNYRFDSGTIPDGDYRARVAVSDLPSNPPDIAKTTNLDSEVFTIDNTAPKIDQLKVAATKDGKYRLTASAHDAATMIASARFKIDAAEWRLAFPADGIFDSPTETFDFGVSLPKPGEHNVALMVVDREGNTTVAKRTVVAK